jgi:hypothetical protein
MTDYKEAAEAKCTEDGIEFRASGKIPFLQSGQITIFVLSGSGST